MRPVLHSYALRDYPMEHVLRFAAADGWPAIELSSWHFDPEFAEDRVRRGIGAAAALADRLGVGLHCVDYWAVFTATDEAERRKWVDTVCMVIDSGARHGVRLVNGAGGWLVRDAEDWDLDWRANGSRLATGQQVRWAAECYRQVARYAAARGVRVAVEVHPNTVHDTVAATARLLELADHDNLVVTLDPANAAVLNAGDREPGVIDLLADRVAYFHLKNCLIRDGVVDFTVDAAGGVVDNYRWLSRLAGLPSVTDVCVEYCGDGDPHPRLTGGRRYLEETLRLVNAETERHPVQPVVRTCG